MMDKFLKSIQRAEQVDVFLVRMGVGEAGAGNNRVDAKGVSITCAQTE
jgi:hypothetical protein